jgi:hypothetical protein
MATLIETGYVVRTQESFDGKPPICVTRVYDMPQVAGVGLAEVGFPDRGETRPLSNEPVLVTNEVSLTATPKEESPRPKDHLFEAIANACGINLTNLTRSSRGQLNKAVKELREVGATPDDITTKAKAYRTQYPNATLTPTALIKHWSSFATIEKQQSRPSIWDTYNPPKEYYA